MKKPNPRALLGPSRRGGLALTLSVLVWATPKHAVAEQFVLVDALFTYTWEDAVAAESRYRVTEANWLNGERPEDWTSPVNYRGGSVHIRLEVLDRPEGDQPVGWALCYVDPEGGSGCPYTDFYTEPGLYERDVAMNSFWNHDAVDWEQGIERVDFVYSINASGLGHVHDFPGLEELTSPTTVRLTMVQVSADDTFDPSIIGPPPSTGVETGEGGAAGGGGDDVDPIGSTGGVGQGGAGVDTSVPRTSSEGSGCSCTWGGVPSSAGLGSALALLGGLLLRRRRSAARGTSRSSDAHAPEQGNP